MKPSNERQKTLTQLFPQEEAQFHRNEGAGRGGDATRGPAFPTSTVSTLTDSSDDNDEDDRDYQLSDDILEIFTQRFIDNDDDSDGGDDSLDLSQKVPGEDDYIYLQKMIWAKGVGVTTQGSDYEGSIHSPLDLRKCSEGRIDNSVDQRLPHTTGRTDVYPPLSRKVTNDEYASPAKKKQKLDIMDFRDIYNGASGSTRTFKIDEAYFSKKDPNKTYIYIIKELFWEKMKQMAKCDKYEKIESTFVGKHVGEALQGTYVLHKYRCNKHLSYFGERTNPPKIGKSLYYNISSGAKSHGFEISYEFEKEYIDEPEEERIGKPTVFDVFCGAGGMSQGLKEADWDVKWALDKDFKAAFTFHFNHKNAEIYFEDVRTFLRKVKENPDSPHYKNTKPDLLQFSAPCQGASRANRTGGKNDRVNNELTPFCAELVEHYKSDFVLYENVIGMLDRKNTPYIERLSGSLLSMNYGIRLQVMDSKRYGDPQSRERVFLFGALPHLDLPSFPKATHGPRLKPYRTTWNAIKELSGVPPVKEGEGRVSYGHNHKNITYNHNETGTTIYKKESTELKEMVTTKYNEPAPTIIRKQNVRHYCKPRCLTVREMAKLFGFPDSFRFHGSIKDQVSQVGNAVSVGVSKAIGEGFMDAYRAHYC